MYAYVLLRNDSTSPFIFHVVDLLTNEILLTRKINLYGAFQGMDYYDGKIVLIYGLGAETPNGIVILNTVGDILYRYNISKVNNMEAEGVCVDRENGGIYFNAYDKILYKII